jgi:hypothetical protein
MRRYSSKTSGALTALLAGTAMLCWSAAAFAGTPTLGPDCGTGAAIVGSDAAGKVTLGQGATTCTLSFSVPYTNAPACSATNETNGGGISIPVGPSTTVTTLLLSSVYPWHASDVISYICLDY